MYKTIKPKKTDFNINKAKVGETIEARVRRIMNNKEGIKDGAPLIYTTRDEGIRADMDVRTDRFEHALDAMDAVAKMKAAQREGTKKKPDLGQQAKEGMAKEGDGKAES